MTLPALEEAARLGLHVELLDVGPSTSMEDHEAKLGVPAGSLCKTLAVRRGADDIVLVVVPGGRRMAWGKVREALGVRRASLATPEEVEAATGYAPGTVSPLGTPTRLPVVVDAAAVGFDRIAVGSGRSGASLLVDGAALRRALDAAVADVTEPV